MNRWHVVTVVCLATCVAGCVGLQNISVHPFRTLSKVVDADTGEELHHVVAVVLIYGEAIYGSRHPLRARSGRLAVKAKILPFQKVSNFEYRNRGYAILSPHLSSSKRRSVDLFLVANGYAPCEIAVHKCPAVAKLKKNNKH